MIWAKKYQNDYTDRLKAILKDTGLSNIFNPSLLHFGDNLIMTFRAIDDVNHGRIESFLLVIEDGFEGMSLVNLTIHAQQHGIPIAADPKLFLEHDKAIWLTFNTGYSKIGNDIYVMRVFPQLEAPMKCIYPTRKKIEKNWAFFFEEDNLFALYSVNPTVILRASNPSETDVAFSLHHHKHTSTDLKLTIGTQVFSLGDDELGLIAHRKITFLGKRLYYGVPVKISKSGQGYQVNVCNVKIAHNFISLFGARKKHNKNLISCTYFSGVCSRGEEVLLGYGINDINYSFATLQKTDLWK